MRRLAIFAIAFWTIASVVVFIGALSFVDSVGAREAYFERRIRELEAETEGLREYLAEDLRPWITETTEETAESLPGSPSPDADPVPEVPSPSPPPVPSPTAPPSPAPEPPTPSPTVPSPTCVPLVEVCLPEGEPAWTP
jgi:hypothetical protein